MFGQIFSTKNSTAVSDKSAIPCKKEKPDSLIELASTSVPVTSVSDIDFDYNSLCPKDEDDDIRIILDPSALEPEAQYLFEICKISIE
ncbi:hypothetical protein CLU79DRAFT_831701 [Phycomyces nitens]|nr:hypothetical protein CLU79DRAFT_831701 [Phycomyces nitens]